MRSQAKDIVATEAVHTSIFYYILMIDKKLP